MFRVFRHSRRLALAALLSACPICRPSASAQQAQTPPDSTQGSAKSQGSKSRSATKQQEKPGQGQPEQPPQAKPIPQLNRYARYDLQGEATFILQSLFPFHSLYSGRLSLPSRGSTDVSETVSYYAGARLTRGVEVYVNPEIAWGGAPGAANGLAGYSNGDLIGQPTLRPYPYLARYFVRWRIATPQHGEKEITETQVGRAPNLIAGTIPAHRVVVTAGKFGVSDIFDVNSYANNPRTQFMNNAFVNNLAYDYAEDTRGYNLGLTANWVNPTWSVRIGSFAMPTAAGGSDLAYNWSNANSEQMEGEIHVRLLGAKQMPFIARALGFVNVGDMGSYSAALAARPAGGIPDINSVRMAGAVKSGFGLNFEQPFGDDGSTGVFGRLGWSDGSEQTYNYAEADRFVSIGAQVSGARWRRKDDRAAVAFAQSDLSAAHRNYLADGGLGFNLGDGALHYGPERILETYYSYQIFKNLALSLDYQLISNPGYNGDRGPASLISLRAHIVF